MFPIIFLHEPKYTCFYTVISSNKLKYIQKTLGFNNNLKVYLRILEIEKQLRNLSIILYQNFL